MNRVKALREISSMMVEFEKLTTGELFYEYNDTDITALINYERVLNNKLGCENHVHIVHAELVQILSNESLLDKDTEKKYNLGVEAVKKINIFRNTYFKDIYDKYEM